jgi:hypothetical protein
VNFCQNLPPPAILIINIGKVSDKVQRGPFKQARYYRYTASMGIRPRVH